MLVLNHATFPNFSVPIVFVWILKGLLFIVSCNLHMGFPGGSDGKESSCNAEDLSSIPGLGWFPGRGRSNPLQCSCLENSHGQRSLAGYSPWDHKVRQDWAAKHSTTQSAYDDNFTSYLPFWMLLFNFFFLFWLLWLGLPVLCWIEVVRGDILVLFQISVGRFSAFHCYVGCGFIINSFYYVDTFFLYTSFIRIFIFF